jgi:hypothetical protein
MSDFTKEAELPNSGSISYLELALRPFCPDPGLFLHINTAYWVPVVLTTRTIQWIFFHCGAGLG